MARGMRSVFGVALVLVVCVVCLAAVAGVDKQARWASGSAAARLFQLGPPGAPGPPGIAFGGRTPVPIATGRDGYASDMQSLGARGDHPNFAADEIVLEPEIVYPVVSSWSVPLPSSVGDDAQSGLTALGAAASGGGGLPGTMTITRFAPEPLVLRPVRPGGRVMFFPGIGGGLPNRGMAAVDDDFGIGLPGTQPKDGSGQRGERFPFFQAGVPPGPREAPSGGSGEGDARGPQRVQMPMIGFVSAIPQASSALQTAIGVLLLVAILGARRLDAGRKYVN